MAIPQTFIQELLARADVVEIVGRYVQLKKGGANYMGLCPFHGEKSPSFSVSPTKQFYHCFGCGKNGNAIGFLMDYAGMNFVEAVKDLAGQYGMQVPEDDTSPADRARAYAQLLDVLRRRTGPTVVVSNEVGLGLHPDTSLGREYRDELGRLNQRVAAAAHTALFLVAGRALPLVDPREVLP